MPISTACNCGKSLRVKEEFAGKKVRCPGCKVVLTVPMPEVSVEDDALSALMSEEPTANSPAEPETSFQPEEKPNFFTKQSLAPKPAKTEYEAPKPRKKRLDPMSREDREAVRRPTGPGIVISGGIISGVLMMVGALIWFFGGLALGFLFYYPPILFILGICAFFRGLTGQEEE